MLSEGGQLWLQCVLHCCSQQVEGAGRHPGCAPNLLWEQCHVTSPSSSAGWILIDRCGKHFGTILNYLRDGAVPLPESRREIELLLAEAKYYLVQGLVEECQAALQVGTFPHGGHQTYLPSSFPSTQWGPLLPH